MQYTLGDVSSGRVGTLLGQGYEWWGPCFDHHQTLGEMECHHARQTEGGEETAQEE